MEFASARNLVLVQDDGGLEVPDGAPTPIPVDDVAGAFGIGSQLVKRLTEGDYLGAVALLLMILIWAFRTYAWPRLSTDLREWVPVVTLVLSTATYFAGAILAGVAPLEAVMTGLSVGFAAVGGWEFVKFILRKLGVLEPKVL